jgi:hypothetical protein
MASFVPIEDDASFSVVGSNYSLVANFSSTLESAYLKVFPQENSNAGFMFGVSNTVFVLGEGSNTPRHDLTIHNGNVGLGVTDVARYTLDVNGDINFNRGFYCRDVPVLFFNNSNVGIANTHPEYSLDVLGSLRVSDTIYTSNLTLLGNTIQFDAVAASNFVIDNQAYPGPALSVTQKTVGGNGVVAQFFDSDVSTTVPVMIVGDTAKVGINTTLPLQPLYVVGNMQTTNTVISSVATGTPPLQVASKTTVANLSVEFLSGLDASYFINATNLSAGTLNAARLPVSGVSSNLYGNNSNIPTFVVDATGRITQVIQKPVKVAYSDVSGLATVATTGNYNDLTNRTFVLNGNDAIYMNGNVGIGYNVPQTTLHLTNTQGDTLMRLSAPNGVANVLGVEMMEDNVPQTGARMVYNTMTEQLHFQSVAGSTITSRMTIDSAYGNVGIGTSDPKAKLHVQGDLLLSGGINASYIRGTNMNADDLTAGTLNAARLPTSGVTSGTYGNASNVSQFVVDATGRITSATNTQIVISRSAITDIVDPWVKNAANELYYTNGNVGIGTTIAKEKLHVMGNMLVAGTIVPTQCNVYDIGSSNYRFRDLYLSGTTIDMDVGRISMADNQIRFTQVANRNAYLNAYVNAINATGDVTVQGNINAANLASSAFINTTNATNITSGTLNEARFPDSGVMAGTYGSASVTPVFNVDATGRVKSVTNTNIAITSTVVSGLAKSATTDTTNATNISSGTLPTARLPVSGVTAAYYGSASIIPVIQVDQYGRLSTVTNTNIAITSTAVTGLVSSATIDTTNATNITSGTLNASRLATSGVNAAKYGSASVVPVFDVDQYGRVTGATNTNIAITSTVVSGLVSSATIDTTNAANITSGTLNANRLATSGVNAAKYGSASVVPVFDVDQYGRVTGVTNTNIAIASSVVSGLVSSATIDTTNATNITSGTLNASRLATSGVNAAKYGSASVVPVFDVDQYGRVTTVTNTSIAIASTVVSGLVSSATIDTTNATNITTGTLNASRLATSGVSAAKYGSASVVPVFDVDQYGRVTGVTNTNIAIASTAVSGLVSSATVDTTNATNITSGTLNASRLATSGVTARVYGSASVVPVFDVDQYGRVLGVTNTNIAITSSVVTGLVTSATVDTTNATNITSGTLNASRLATSGVSAAKYGSASVVPVFDVDQYGRVTGVTNTNIAIAATAVSGLATVATSGNYNDLSNKTFVLNGTNAYYTSGNVGIGTNAPLAALAVGYGPTDVTSTLMFNSGDTSSNTDKVIFTHVANGSRIGHSAGWSVNHYAGRGADTTGNFRFYLGTGTANLYNERVTFAYTGNVGIGSSTPAYTLDVKTGSGDINFIGNLYYNAKPVLSSGVLNASMLPTSGASAGSYGSATIVPTFSVDDKGRVLSISNTTIAIASTSVSGLASSATIDTTNATNITSGTLNASRLATSGVNAAKYGSASVVPVFDVDQYGRVTGVTNTNIFIASTAVSGLVSSATIDSTNATNISSGTLNTSRLATSGVSAAKYGSASVVPVFDVDQYGRVTTVTNTNIAIASTAVSGLVSSATIDTTNATNIASGTLNASRLATSGVTAAKYGSASIVPVFDVDQYGRVLGVTNTNIAIASSSVSGLVSSATTDTTNATNITTGTLNTARLATSGVSAAKYGSASIVPVFDVDQYGRVLSVTNTNIALAATAVSGLATVATSGNYNDLTNKTFVLNGTTAYYNGGNVGIGYNNTSYKLAVGGDVYVDSTLYASNITVLGNVTTLNTTTSNTEQFYVNNAGSGPALQVTQTGPQPVAYFYDDANIALAIADGGAVGIGTTNPGYPLEVVGTINIKGAIYQNGAPLVTGTNATNITTGTLNASRLEASGVTARVYGSASLVPVFDVDQYGRVKSVTNTSIAVTSSAVSGLVSSATTDTTNATNITTGTLNASRLEASGVSARVYGSASLVPVFDVDQYGRIKSVTNTSIAITSTAVTGLVTSATTDTTNATNITTGTLNASRLEASGVTARVYGSASVVPVFDVDTYGRVKSVTNTSIAITSTAVSGLVTSATTDTTNATNITTGTLNASRLEASGVTARVYGSASIVPVFDVDQYGRVKSVTNTSVAITSSAVSGLVSSATTDTTNATNITTGTLNASRLEASGVTARVYGSASVVPVFDVDTYGRVKSVTNTSIAITSTAVSGLVSSATIDTTNATNITTGTLNASRLTASGVTAAKYGSASVVPVFDVDQYGRVTGVTNTNIAIASTAVTGLVASATTDTTNASNITSGTLNASRLATSGVSAAVYGSASVIPVFDVDTYGRVKSVTNTSVAITSSAVSGLVSSATTDTTNATNITTGTLNASRLEASGVTARVYGSATVVPVFDVDQYGRVKSVTNTSIAIASGAVSGLVSSATTDTTNATNITTGTLNASRLEASGVNARVYGSASVVPVFDVDTYGRVKSVTNTSIAIASSAVTGLVASATLDTTNATNISTGTLNASLLEASGVTARVYGSASLVPVFDVDQYGRVKSVTNTSIAIASSVVSGLVSSATIDATNAANITSGKLNTSRLEVSGVTASVYGSATVVPVIQVDTYGRVTSVTNTNISLADTTNATNISSGTLNSSRLETTGVTAATYGGSSAIPIISIDQYGRVTTATNASVQISSTFQVSNNNAYYTAGNVGIGMSSPDYTLDVTGTLRAVGQGGSSKALVYKNGNVGIGSEVPSTELEVAGTVKAIKFIGDGSLLTGVATTASSGSSQWIYKDYITSNIYYKDGNVGIGTDASLATLHVKGSLLVDGDLTYTGQQFIGEDTRFIRNHLQINPFRFSYNLTATTQTFIQTISGLYAVYASNTDVHQNGYKLSWIDNNNCDYSVSYYNTTSNTVFTVTLAEPAAYGDIIDITAWPSYLDPNNGKLLPGYMVQNFFSQWSTVDTGSNIYYTAGNVGIGTSNPKYPLHVHGDLFATNIISYSDAKYKTDIKTVPNAIETLTNIRGVTYKLVNDLNRTYMGVIAQEIEPYIPQVVHTDDNGMKSVSYGNMIGLFIEGIKDIYSLVKKQQDDIDDIKRLLAK